MEEKSNSNKFKELLDKLQQESWQLELLISGFAIFGLISAIGPIEGVLNEAIAQEKPYFPIAFRFALASCYILIINLVIHVVIRGLWIGAIGLRYVSNDIDYQELNYNKRFTNYLKKKVGSFDDYIARLENYCSILFAVTFLTLFYFISFLCGYIVLFFAAKFLVISDILPKITGAIIFTLFLFVYGILSLMVFIDFITQGYLKKKEWTSFLYMPVYKIFSIITLSFLYRPLVYNFLDNKFGKRIAFVLVPLYGIIFYLATMNNIRSNYISENSFSSEYFSKNSNYLSMLEEDQYVKVASIQDKVIKDQYLKVFIPFKEKTEDLLLELNKDLKPQKDSRGFKSDFTLFSSTNSRKKSREHFKEKDSMYGVYLKTFNENYILYVDSLFYPSNFIITNVNNQLGFETVLPTNRLAEGKHLLKISRNIYDEKTDLKNQKKLVNIPFWYYKK